MIIFRLKESTAGNGFSSSRMNLPIPEELMIVRQYKNKIISLIRRPFLNRSHKIEKNF